MKYTHAIPIEHNLSKGPLWEYKHNETDIKRIEKADPYVKSAQYDQEPAPKGGSIFKTEWWRYYDLLPYCFHKIITADTGQKVKSTNDFSVFQCWGKAREGIFLIDQIRGKWEAPDLLQQARSFYMKHNAGKLHVSQFYIEDKSSGSSLIQTLRRANDQRYDKIHIPVCDIQRNTNKVVRAHGVVGYISAGYVHLPNNVEWLSDYVTEFSKFTPLMNHKHDDQIDPTMDAIEKLLIKSSTSDDNDGFGTVDGIGATQENEIF
jgi:predicted phage terminase large subunit-like protein